MLIQRKEGCLRLNYIDLYQKQLLSDNNFIWKLFKCSDTILWYNLLIKFENNL